MIQLNSVPFTMELIGFNDCIHRCTITVRFMFLKKKIRVLVSECIFTVISI